MFSRVHIGRIFVHRPRLVGGNFTSILGEGIAVQVAWRFMLNILIDRELINQQAKVVLSSF